MPQRHMPKFTPASLRTSAKAAFLVALTVLAYLPALRNGFIWDDDAWLMHNRTLEGMNGLYRLWFVLSLLFFVCALLSKSMTCSLPVVLTILIWWKRERISPADFRPLLPYFLVGLPMGLLTAWLEVHHVGAAGVSFDLEFYQRCIVAGRAVP